MSNEFEHDSDGENYVDIPPHPSELEGEEGNNETSNTPPPADAPPKEKRVAFVNEMKGASNEFIWSVAFDAPLDTKTVNETTFVLCDEVGNMVPAKVQYDKVFGRANILILGEYKEDVTYYLVLTPGIKSKNGKARTKKSMLVKFSTSKGLISSKFMRELTPDVVPMMRKISKDLKLPEIIPPAPKKKLNLKFLKVIGVVLLVLAALYTALYFATRGEPEPSFGFKYDYDWVVDFYLVPRGAAVIKEIPEAQMPIPTYDFELPLGETISASAEGMTVVLASTVDGVLRQEVASSSSLIYTLSGFKSNKYRFYFHNTEQNTQTDYYIRAKVYHKKRLNNEFDIDPQKIPVGEENKKKYIEIDFKNGYAASY